MDIDPSRLHIACDHGAPPALVKAILHAWPEGGERVGTNLMNPLHIACSITNASVEVVQILLAGCRDPVRVTSAKVRPLLCCLGFLTEYLGLVSQEA